MTSTKYIGMDVHKESISIAVRNAAGKIVMECVIETKASTILQFIDGLCGEIHLTFEGTWAAWLHDLLKPHVSKVVVCDPRRNALLQEGNSGGARAARTEEEAGRDSWTEQKLQSRFEEPVQGGSDRGRDQARSLRRVLCEIVG